MGKCKEHPRYNVLSVRVTDQAMRKFKRLAESKRVRVSDLLRDILEDYTDAEA